MKTHEKKEKKNINRKNVDNAYIYYIHSKWQMKRSNSNCEMKKINVAAMNIQ